MPRSPRSTRAEYPYLLEIPTRWSDNDVYGHVNNVVYYSFFDTLVNQFLIKNSVLDINDGDLIGLVVETNCQYFAPVAFPKTIVGGLRTAHIGNSSVRYEIGVFDGGNEAIAEGFFVHVYVDRQTRKPTPLPAPLRATLETIAKVHNPET
ncbi:MAG: thioesterase family protein [Pseudomonadota bacterium]